PDTGEQSSKARVNAATRAVSTSSSLAGLNKGASLSLVRMLSAANPVNLVSLLLAIGTLPCGEVTAASGPKRPIRHVRLMSALRGRSGLDMLSQRFSEF